MNITQENIWSIYCPVYAKLTPYMLDELLKYTASKARGDVLDVGTGVGKLFNHLRDNARISSALGIDTEKEMVKQANHLLNSIGDQRFSVKQTELDEVEDTWTTITSVNVIYALDNPIDFLRNCYKKLRIGGILVLSSPNLELDMDKLGMEVDKEFSGRKELAEDYALFKECNQYLASSSFKPRFFDLGEMVSIVQAIGFRLKEATSSHLLGSNFTIVAER